MLRDNFWKRHEKPCPYAEGNRCFIVPEPTDDSCRGCRWYEWYKQNKAETEAE